MENNTHTYIYDVVWNEIGWQVFNGFKLYLLKQNQKYIDNHLLHLVSNSVWNNIINQARDYLITQTNEDL